MTEVTASKPAKRKLSLGESVELATIRAQRNRAMDAAAALAGENRVLHEENERLREELRKATEAPKAE